MSTLSKEATSGWSLGRAVKIMLAIFVVTTFAMAAYYANDRYRYQNVSIVDRQIQQLEEMVQRDPQNLTARLAVADAYLARKANDQAIVQYGMVLEADPNRMGTLIGIGLAYRGKGDTAKMIAYFDSVVELGTGDYAQFDRRLQVVYYYLGQAYLQQGDHDKAIENLQASLKIKGSDADVLYLLGNAYQAKGDHDTAVAAYGRATQFVPNFLEAYQAMAISFEKKSDPARATYARGMAAFSKSDQTSALRLLEKAVSQVPDDPILLYGFGMVSEQAGQKEKAVDAYRRTLSASPGYRPAEDALARLGAN